MRPTLLRQAAAQATKLCIIGSGPAAHTAAIYAARAELQPILFEGFMAVRDELERRTIRRELIRRCVRGVKDDICIFLRLRICDTKGS